MLWLLEKWFLKTLWLKSKVQCVLPNFPFCTDILFWGGGSWRINHISIYVFFLLIFFRYVMYTSVVLLLVEGLRVCRLGGRNHDLGLAYSQPTQKDACSVSVSFLAHAFDHYTRSKWRSAPFPPRSGSPGSGSLVNKELCFPESHIKYTMLTRHPNLGEPEQGGNGAERHLLRVL